MDQQAMASNHRVTASTIYRVECRDKYGNLKWVEDLHNLVVTAGLNLLLDRSFKNVPADVNWYVGLKSTGTPDAADTMGSHASWTEITAYDESTRPALTLGTISAGSVNNSASKATFTISGTTTVYGVFTVTNSTKGGTTGTLYGAGDFGTPRAVVDDDVINVQVTKTVTAS